MGTSQYDFSVLKCIIDISVWIPSETGHENKRSNSFDSGSFQFIELYQCVNQSLLTLFHKFN